jgi:hypothetical protein
MSNLVHPDVFLHRSKFPRMEAKVNSLHRKKIDYKCEMDLLLLELKRFDWKISRFDDLITIEIDNPTSEDIYELRRYIDIYVEDRLGLLSMQFVEQLECIRVHFDLTGA